jgi:hypothetical protein
MCSRLSVCLYSTNRPTDQSPDLHWTSCKGNALERLSVRPSVQTADMELGSEQTQHNRTTTWHLLWHSRQHSVQWFCRPTYMRFKNADAQLPFNNQCYFVKRVESYRMIVALGDLMVSMRARQRSWVQTRPRTMGFLRTIKIRSTHSFGGTVKPSAPSVFCPKILLHVKEQYDYEIHTSQVKLSISSAMIYSCFATRWLCW